MVESSTPAEAAVVAAPISYDLHIGELEDRA